MNTQEIKALKMIKAMQVQTWHAMFTALDKIEIEDIRCYFEYLATEQSLSGASCCFSMASAFVGQCLARRRHLNLECVLL